MFEPPFKFEKISSHHVAIFLHSKVAFFEPCRAPARPGMVDVLRFTASDLSDSCKWRMVSDLASSLVGVNTFVRATIVFAKMLTLLERFRETARCHAWAHPGTRCAPGWAER